MWTRKNIQNGLVLIAPILQFICLIKHDSVTTSIGDMIFYKSSESIVVYGMCLISIPILFYFLLDNIYKKTILLFFTYFILSLFIPFISMEGADAVF